MLGYVHLTAGHPALERRAAADMTYWALEGDLDGGLFPGRRLRRWMGRLERCGVSHAALPPGREAEFAPIRPVLPDGLRLALLPRLPWGRQVWTRFTFPGRAGTYSDFEWDWTCFHGTDWDEATGRKGLWLFEGKKWDENVDNEFGNFDYLMGTDVHLTDPKVMDHLVEWGSWYLETTGVDGLRMDALKHMGRDFTMAWLDRMRDVSGKELFTVGEYWSADLSELRAFIGDDRRLSLFDVPLHFNFHHASRANGAFDMGGIFNGTLVDADPTMAVTFVENHDTQDGQSLASPVDSWFKPAAYALILLREAGYPCVFHADLFGAEGEHPIAPVEGLETLMKLRKTHAYGVQWDAFDDSHVVGWARQGQADDASDGVAVVVSDSGESVKTLNVGAHHAGQVWECVIGGCEPVQIGDDGSALFPVPDSGLSVYSPKGV